MIRATKPILGRGSLWLWIATSLAGCARSDPMDQTGAIHADVAWDVTLRILDGIAIDLARATGVRLTPSGEGAIVWGGLGDPVLFWVPAEGRVDTIPTPPGWRGTVGSLAVTDRDLHLVDSIGSEWNPLTGTVVRRSLTRDPEWRALAIHGERGSSVRIASAGFLVRELEADADSIGLEGLAQRATPVVSTGDVMSVWDRNWAWRATWTPADGWWTLPIDVDLRRAVEQVGRRWTVVFAADLFGNTLLSIADEMS